MEIEVEHETKYHFFQLLTCLWGENWSRERAICLLFSGLALLLALTAIYCLQKKRHHRHHPPLGVNLGVGGIFDATDGAPLRCSVNHPANGVSHNGVLQFGTNGITNIPNNNNKRIPPPSFHQHQHHHLHHHGKVSNVHPYPRKEMLLMTANELILLFLSFLSRYICYHLDQP